jgi:hypothetical protein
MTWSVDALAAVKYPNLAVKLIFCEELLDSRRASAAYIHEESQAPGE